MSGETPSRRVPRLPPDVAGVVDAFRALGEAARRGLHVAERRARHEVAAAAKAAAALTARLRGRS